MPAKKRSRVREARDRAGLSQKALAERAGLATSTVARIELGQHHPSVGVAITIARELGEPVESLFGGER
jgi:putative transcriptional regulator